jgi:5'-phosphate synthase pdxT subunit
MTDSTPLVGVLAVQGDFAAHQASLHRLGVKTRQVRTPHDLIGIDGLVLPGGESTTMLKLLDLQGLVEPLTALVESAELPVLATCAGLILLAREVVGPEQASLGALDLKVARNGYGRQIHSGTVALRGPGVPAGTTGVFIRAPRILAVGAGVEVLAWRGDDPALVRCGPILAACFHPELQPEHWVTGLFVGMLRARTVAD